MIQTYVYDSDVFLWFRKWRRWKMLMLITINDRAALATQREGRANNGVKWTLEPVTSQSPLADNRPIDIYDTCTFIPFAVHKSLLVSTARRREKQRRCVFATPSLSPPPRTWLHCKCGVPTPKVNNRRSPASYSNRTFRSIRFLSPLSSPLFLTTHPIFVFPSCYSVSFFLHFLLLHIFCQYVNILILKLSSFQSYIHFKVIFISKLPSFQRNLYF